MPNTELAEELLQLEEADAWFEYLESTRGQMRDALLRARAMGLGSAVAAAASRACTPCASAARGRVTARETGADETDC